MKDYSLIAAISKNGIIGNGLKIPWHIPEDFKLFKEKTQNNIIIMGAKTWDALNRKALPNRINIIISKNQFKVPIECYLVKSIEDAFKKANEFKDKDIFIIGGGTIYSQTIENAKYLYISHIKEEYEGNIFFPKFDEKKYEILEEKEFDKFIFRKYSKLN